MHLQQRAAIEHEQASIGVLESFDISYWETYDVGHSPLADYPELAEQDRGIHVLVGSPEHVGRGLGSHLIRAVAMWQLNVYPAALRVVAEPNARNVSAIHAYQRCGFRQLGTIELPGKRAAVMVIDRYEVPGSSS